MKTIIELRKSIIFEEFKKQFKNELSIFFKTIDNPIFNMKKKSNLKKIIYENFEKIFYNVYQLGRLIDSRNFLDKSLMIFEKIRIENSDEFLLKLSYSGNSHKYYQLFRLKEDFTFPFDKIPVLESYSKEIHFVYWGGVFLNKKITLKDENFKYELENFKNTIVKSENALQTETEYKNGLMILRSILNPSQVGQKILESYSYKTRVSDETIEKDSEFYHNVILKKKNKLFVSIEDSRIPHFNSCFMLHNNKKDLIFRFFLKGINTKPDNEYFDNFLVHVLLSGQISEVQGVSVSELNINIENFFSEGLDLISILKDINLTDLEKQKISRFFLFYNDIISISNTNNINEDINYNKESYYPFIISYINDINKLEKTLKNKNIIV